jgi:hypothetical protein
MGSTRHKLKRQFTRNRACFACPHFDNWTDFHVFVSIIRAIYALIFLLSDDNSIKCDCVLPVCPGSKDAKKQDMLDINYPILKGLSVSLHCLPIVHAVALHDASSSKYDPNNPVSGI